MNGMSATTSGARSALLARRAAGLRTAFGLDVHGTSLVLGLLERIDDMERRLRERATEAITRLGVGSGSVRTIAGTMDIHMELERRLAAFKQTEAVVVFQSGFTANAGTVSSILGRDDVLGQRVVDVAVGEVALLLGEADEVPYLVVDATGRDVRAAFAAGKRRVLGDDGLDGFGMGIGVG